MNKKLFSRCLLAITLSLSSICLANTKGSFDSASNHRYHNSEFNFSLQIPKGWYNFTSAAIQQQKTLEGTDYRVGLLDDIGTRKILLALAHPHSKNESIAELRILSTKPHWYSFNTTAKNAALELRAGFVNFRKMKLYEKDKKHTLSIVAYSPVHSTVINGQQFFTLDAQYLFDKKVKMYESILFTKRSKHIIEIHNFATSTRLLQQALKLGHTIQFLPLKTT